MHRIEAGGGEERPAGQALIFFDVDGTILDERYRVPPSAARAIGAARRNGHLCVVNTGRPFSHLEPAVREIGFDGFVCSCGQHVLLDGKSVFRKRLAPEVCRGAVELIRAGRLGATLEDEAGIWFLDTRPIRQESVDARAHFAARGFQVELPPEAPVPRFDKFCVWLYPDSDPGPLFDFIRPFCTVIDRGGGLYELVALGCSKKTGIRMVMEKANIPPERCYALGDGPNDLPMFQCVGHSVAMGEAPEHVKAAAEYVTCGLWQDGLSHALGHYGLI